MTGDQGQFHGAGKNWCLFFFYKIFNLFTKKYFSLLTSLQAEIKGPSACFVWQKAQPFRVKVWLFYLVQCMGETLTVLSICSLCILFMYIYFCVGIITKLKYCCALRTFFYVLKYFLIQFSLKVLYPYWPHYFPGSFHSLFQMLNYVVNRDKKKPLYMIKIWVVTLWHVKLSRYFTRDVSTFFRSILSLATLDITW